MRVPPFFVSPLPPVLGGVILFLSLVAQGCGSPNSTQIASVCTQEPPPCEIECLAFVTVKQPTEPEDMAQDLDPFAGVITTEDEWLALWKKYFDPLSSGNPSPPTIDFTTEMVVAYFAGAAGPGDTAEIRAIARGAKELIVHARHRIFIPSPGTILPAIVINPYHIVRLGKSSLPVRFEITMCEERG